MEVAKMISSRVRTAPRLLSYAGLYLLAILMALSLPLASHAAAAQQAVTLTMTTSTTSTYIDTDFDLRVTASQPITGPIKLNFTINGEGPYVINEQMTNGAFERTFGCESTGNWTLWFVWDGDQQYSRAQSNSITVYVNPGSPPDNAEWILLAIIGVIVIVAVIAIVLVLYSRSKMKGKSP